MYPKQYMIWYRSRHGQREVIKEKDTSKVRKDGKTVKHEDKKEESEIVEQKGIKKE